METTNENSKLRSLSVLQTTKAQQKNKKTQILPLPLLLFFESEMRVFVCTINHLTKHKEIRLKKYIEYLCVW